MQIEQPEQLAILSAVGGSPIEMFQQCRDDSPNWMISTSGGEQERRNLDLRWLPGAAQAYGVSPDLSDYVVVPVTTVVSSCPNMNGDAILPADLLQYNPEYAKYAYQTFIGKGTYVEHRDNLVLKAAKWAADGLPPRNITMRLQSLAKRVELSFVLDRLDFMAKSGRCSGVLAFGANLLGIKPALEVIDGELKVVKKYRGSLPICVGKYITDRLVERDDIEDSLVFISSCQPKPGCMDAVKAGLKKYGSFKECHETDIGTTIGGYSGPGTIGIVFARKEK